MNNGVVSLKESGVNEILLDYLYKLVKADKYWTISREEVWETVTKFNYRLWRIFYKCIPTGIVGIHYRPEVGWCIDGYRDDHACNTWVDNKVSCPLIAGTLITDYVLNNLSDVIYSFHPQRNRGASILCLRMGYKKIEEFTGDGVKFILFSKRRQ